MKVLLHDADDTKFPNLALMKLSAAYKARGHEVAWYAAGLVADKIISSKVFTFTPAPDLPSEVITGGGGYQKTTVLPAEIEHICPDYSLYGIDYSLGFLTRGCIRKCAHCFVHKREGTIRPNADIEEFARHRDVVLMDNNVLAHQHGLDQIDKMTSLGLRVDFNQGLDARLIDDSAAKRLSKLKWLHPLRLACDHVSQMDSVFKAVTLLRWNNTVPSRYFCYVLIKDVEDALERIKFLKAIYVDPFAQPFIDEAGTPPTLEQKQLARWCNHKALFKKVTFEEYKETQGDRV